MILAQGKGNKTLQILCCRLTFLGLTSCKGKFILSWQDSDHPTSHALLQGRLFFGLNFNLAHGTHEAFELDQFSRCGFHSELDSAY